MASHRAIRRYGPTRGRRRNGYSSRETESHSDENENPDNVSIATENCRVPVEAIGPSQTELRIATTLSTLSQSDNSTGVGEVKVDYRYVIRDLVGDEIFPRMKFITNKEALSLYDSDRGSICQLVVRRCQLQGSEREKQLWWLHNGSKCLLRKMTDCRNNRCTEMQRAWMSKLVAIWLIT